MGVGVVKTWPASRIIHACLLWFDVSFEVSGFHVAHVPWETLFEMASRSWVIKTSGQQKNTASDAFSKTTYTQS